MLVHCTGVVMADQAGTYCQVDEAALMTSYKDSGNSVLRIIFLTLMLVHCTWVVMVDQAETYSRVDEAALTTSY